MSYWACAQLEANRERLALHCLELGGFTTYLPRVRERRRVNGRQVATRPALFPGYAFVSIELKWHAARWCPGVLRLVLDGAKPARVPQTVIEGLKARERNGVIILPPHHRRAAADFAVGDRLRVTSGPFTGLIGLYQGQRGADRVAMLLRWLGADRPAVLPRSDVARMMR